MSNISRKKSGGSKKIGRSARKPAHKRYNTEGRREKNKARKAAKIAKDLEKKAARKVRKNENKG